MDHSGMSMDSGSASGGMSMTMMVPYLHIQGGDNLFFESWRPTSPAAIAGACVGLFFLALFERCFSSMRGVMEAHWRRRAATTIVSPPSGQSILRSPLLTEKAEATTSTEEVPNNIQETSSQSPPPQTTRRRRFQRTIPPFIPAHDFARGLMYAGQTLLSYILMLAVMTFQAAYIISIVVGLAIGEVLFGRFGVRHDFAH